MKTPTLIRSIEQDLADGVVYLVGAGVVEVLALQVNLRPPQLLGESLGEVKGAGPAHVVLQVIVDLRLERRVGLRLAVGRLQLEQCRHQGLGHIAAAKLAEVSSCVRKIVHCVVL